MPGKRIIGQKIPRIDSRELVTGTAEFTGDVVLPGMLHGRILRSPIAHGQILHVDTTRAKKLLGVRAVLTGKDVPQNIYGAGSGGASVPGAIPDEQILCTEKVRYVGDPIAAVAAVDRDTADEALQLHGGYGFIGDHDIERFYRDSKIVEIYEGTKEIEMIIIARALLGK